MKLIKSNLIVLTALSLALLASCKKDKPSGGGTPDGKGFTAITEQDGGNGKTHLDGVVVKWTAYDQIKVANYGGGSGSTTLTYELTEGAGNTQGIFYTGADHADFFHPNYVAAYPAAKVTSISGSTVTFNLLKTQTLGENSFGEGCNPMVAYSSNQTLQFKNVLGALCFRFKGVDKIGSLRLTSKNTSDKLWGSCEVTVGSNGVPTGTTITNTDADKHIITLNCNNIQLDDDEETLFYIMLPPGTLASGFTLEVLDESGMVFYSHDGSIGTSTEYPEGYIVRNRVIKPSNHLYLKVGAIHSKFTINSSGDKVYFSKGNLKYTKATDVWSFMDYQYSYLETFDTVGEDYVKLGMVGLFGWGTSGYDNTKNDSYAIHFQPYSTGIATVSTTYNHYGYGPSTNMTDISLVGTSANYDWGVYNPISNGGNKAGQWRTLTGAEWEWIMGTVSPVPGTTCRTSSTVNNVANARFAKARITGKGNGVIVFPDNYTHPSDVPDPTSINVTDVATPNTNTYTLEQWTKMENAGCVFLSANGWRSGQRINAYGGNGNLHYGGVVGNYWSSTAANAQNAWGLSFNDNLTYPEPPDGPGGTALTPLLVVDGIRNRGSGFSVRLVRDIN